MALQIRVSADEKAAFTQAARLEGLSVSAWLRRLGLTAVRKVARATQGPR